MRSQVTNMLVLDKAEEGQEGPWLSYARMHTLRSPKDFTGPDLDIPSLTYQSWHEARFGKEDWQNLDLIPRELWAEYLLWFRRAVGLPVRNDCEVVEIAPAAVDCSRPGSECAGVDIAVCAQDRARDRTGGHGRLDHPGAAAPFAGVALRAAADPIDFVRLRGKRWR